MVEYSAVKTARVVIKLPVYECLIEQQRNRVQEIKYIETDDCCSDNLITRNQ